MKQPNSLVQFSVNDVALDSLSECAEQILAKEEAVLVIGGHLQHSSLLDKQKIGLMVKCTPERGHNALFFIPLEVFIML